MMEKSEEKKHFSRRGGPCAGVLFCGEKGKVSRYVTAYFVD